MAEVLSTVPKAGLEAVLVAVVLVVRDRPHAGALTELTLGAGDIYKAGELLLERLGRGG